MKTKRVIIGSCFAILLLILVPSVPAMEYKTAMDTNKTRLLEEFNALDLDALKERLQNINDPRIQKASGSLDFDKLKQTLADEHFIDIALILIMLNFLVNRFFTVLTQGSSSKNRILSSLAFIASLSFYLIIILLEYQSGNVIYPRDRAYSLYFTTLFSIIVTLLLMFIPNSMPLVKAGFSLLLGFILGLLSTFLANILTQSIGNTS